MHKLADRWHTVIHLHFYSSVPNRRDGWNKRDGRTFPSKSINVMVLINVMVGNFEKLFHPKV